MFIFLYARLLIRGNEKLCPRMLVIPKELQSRYFIVKKTVENNAFFKIVLQLGKPTSNNFFVFFSFASFPGYSYIIMYSEIFREPQSDRCNKRVFNKLIFLFIRIKMEIKRSFFCIRNVKHEPK